MLLKKLSVRQRKMLAILGEPDVVGVRPLAGDPGQLLVAEAVPGVGYVVAVDEVQK